eukprot:91965-Pelagomonas_calceolata.AAC.2
MPSIKIQSQLSSLLGTVEGKHYVQADVQAWRTNELYRLRGKGALALLGDVPHGSHIALASAQLGLCLVVQCGRILI